MNKKNKAQDKFSTLRIGLAQINSMVGDISGNLDKIRSYCQNAVKKGIDLIVFPELAITGYPPEDLLLKPAFIRDNLSALNQLARALENLPIIAIIGFVNREKDIYNSAGVLQAGRLSAVYHKRYLPNYGVFDEDRYFKPGDGPLILEWGKLRIGLTICEDLWYPESAELGEVELILNLSSSPYHYKKGEFRERMFGARAIDTQAIVAFCNMVGGQDELVFDGGSAVFNPKGEVIARAKFFEEDFLIVDLDLEQVFRYRLHEPRARKQKDLDQKELKLKKVKLKAFPNQAPRKKSPLIRIEPKPEPLEEVFKALALGTRDYVRKNHFQKVLVGLSGGIDSSLVAGIAVSALSKNSVVGVTMPSQFTSKETRADAFKLAKNLDIKILELPIDKIFQAYLDTLKKMFFKYKPDVTEENIQARIRGNLLMALSNKFGWLVLTSGNKSELATGYCTLYGDMAGGFAVIKDVPKTLVYELAEFYNRSQAKELIPRTIIHRAPSAELRPNQKDQDTLPAYEILDPILQGYIVEDLGFEELLQKGGQAQTIKRVIQMVDKNEYKRRQAPPGVKITPRAFGRDWRLPITNKYNQK